MIRQLNRIGQKLNPLKSNFHGDHSVETKKKPTIFSLRTIGVVIMTAVAINMVSSILLDKQLNLWGWILRGLFLLIALAALFSNASLITAKKSSWVLKKLKIG